MFNKQFQYLIRLNYKIIYFFYRILKKILKPLVFLHPRVYRFSIAIRQAVRELLIPPEYVNNSYVVQTYDTFTHQDQAEPDNKLVLRKKQYPNELPSWLIEEIKEIHAIEPKLFPDKWLVDNTPFYRVPQSRIAKPYEELIKLCGNEVAYLFFVPWLVKGGSDLETINYISAIDKLCPNKNIVVLSTFNIASPWKDRLPEKVRFIEFGRLYHHLSNEEQERLLVRLILQMTPIVVHNVNSELSYILFSKYGKALKQVSKLFTSIFCTDITEEGKNVGYSVWFLPECFDVLEGVFCDNRAHIDKLVEIYGFDERKMHVHYQPMPDISHKKKTLYVAPKKQLDILWAGRLDRQKRPDLLISIAEKCMNKPFKFHVYGSFVLDSDIYSKMIKKSHNIIFHGAFSGGLPSLPINEYDVYLYTSQWDGLPNVLLEAISLGLPIITSDVGGINELIEDEITGFLIKPYDDVERYVECLSKIYNEQPLIKSMADKSYASAFSKHSWYSFHQNLKNIGGYLTF